MILRNSNTGGVEVYDISNNQITGAAFMGAVGLNWQFSGVGNFRCGILIRPMTALGHSRPMRSKPREHVCPLLPESGQLADGLGMSAWCHKRLNAG